MDLLIGWLMIFLLVTMAGIVLAGIVSWTEET